MAAEQTLDVERERAALPTTAADPKDTDEAGTLRELLRVAVPLIVSSGSQSLIHVIDRIILARWSVDAVAAAMPAGILFWSLLSLPFGTAVYVNTFVAQYTGAGQKERVSASLWQGTYFALICGSLLACCGPFAPQLLSWTGHSGPVLSMEIDYFSVLSYGALPALLTVVFSAYFSGRGRTVVVMCVNLAAAVINGVLDVLLVFGLGPIPSLGIAGAAWATNFANVFSCGAFAVLLVYAMRAEGYPVWSARRFDRELSWRMLRYGLPTGFQFLVDVGAFLLFVVFVGRLGTAQLAATTIAFNLNSMAFIPMYGMGTGILTIVGRRIGEKRPDHAARTTWLGLKVSAAYMSACAVVYLFLPHLLLIPYVSKDPASFVEVEPMVVVLLRFVSMYLFFDAMAIVFGSAIRGAGDSQFSLWWTFALSWLLMVLPTFLAVRWGYGGLYACWTAATVYITVLGIGFLWRFRAGHWREMSVIETSAAH
jgi:MATE family multidrug resistance protein